METSPHSPRQDLNRRAFMRVGAAAGISGTLASHSVSAADDQIPSSTHTNLWTTYVTDFGAKGDAITDDTAAFQAALNAAAAKGGIVYAPAGTYRIDGSLDIPPGVTLRGVWEAPHHADIDKGTLLYATSHKGTEDGPPLIMLHQSSAVMGLTVFYPEQIATDIQPYPWCIQGSGMHCSVVNVTLVNPYKGIDFGTNPNELHYISNVFGQPLKTGIFVDKTTDVGRIENVHFNPHSWARAAFPTSPKEGSDAWAALKKYLLENFVGFVIGRTDWEYMRDCFCIFPKIGFHFINTPNGSPNAVLTQCGADICPVAVQVDASQPHAGIAFENGQFMGTLVVGPDNLGPVKLSNCGFWNSETTNEQVLIYGKNTVTLTGCHFANWAIRDRNAPCIRIEHGVVILTACDFMSNLKTQIVIERGAKGAIVSGCRLRGGEKIENKAGEHVLQMAANLTA